MFIFTGVSAKARRVWRRRCKYSYLNIFTIAAELYENIYDSSTNQLDGHGRDTRCMTIPGTISSATKNSRSTTSLRLSRNLNTCYVHQSSLQPTHRHIRSHITTYKIFVKVYYTFVLTIRTHSVDPFTRKDWYDIKAPSMFDVRQVGKTLVNRTQGLRKQSFCLGGYGRCIASCARY